MAIQIIGLALALTLGRLEPVTSPPDAVVTAATAPAKGAPLDDSALAGISGGAAPAAAVISTTTLSATNTGNSINAGGDVNSGSIDIGAAALGYTGIGNFVFNTGNNNNLQGNITVNVLLAP